jgi:DNA-binding NtrC family response regulator
VGSFPFLIGEHPSFEEVHALIAELAATDTTVLISGESGTGKELAARALHALSARAGRPFLSLNCGAYSGESLESELFGDERGAFMCTAATRAGLFQLASGGTVFLEDIGEMSLPVQAKLMRVFLDHKVRPVGGDRVVKVDVRVLAATNSELARVVERGTFRKDLWNRLQIGALALPALRERRSDIPVLAAHFLAKHGSRCLDPPRRITGKAMVLLREYDWPGNVRQLEHLIERLVVLANPPAIEAEDLPSELHTFISEARIPRPHLPMEGLDLRQATLSFERELISEALRRTRGNKVAAARLLAIGRTTLSAKLHGHPPSPFRSARMRGVS